jgi:hypothetical protein
MQHTCGALHMVAPHLTGPALPPSTVVVPLDDPLLLPLDEPLLLPLDEPLLLLLVPASSPDVPVLLSVLPPHAAASATPTDTTKNIFIFCMESSSARNPWKGTHRSPERARLTQVPDTVFVAYFSVRFKEIGCSCQRPM